MFRLKYQLYLSIYTGTTKCQIPTKWHVEVVFLNHFSHFSKKINYWKYRQQHVPINYTYDFTTKKCSREKLFPGLISEKSKNKALTSYKIFVGNINPVKSVYSIKIFIPLNISCFIFF